MAESTEPDAKDILRKLLQQNQLGGLFDDIWSGLSQTKITPDMSIDQIGFMIKDTQAYKDRFAGNVALASKGKGEYSISEYLSLEKQYKNAIQGSGIPADWYDKPDDYAKFIGGEISVAEVKDRVTQGFSAVQNGDPEILRQLRTFYPDVNNGDLAAFFLDPTVGTDIILNKAKAAQIGATAVTQAGFQLSQQEAESIRQQGLSQSQVQQGFQQIGLEENLYQPLMQGEEQLGRETIIGAGLGTNAAATQRVEQRRRQRRAQFEAGGGLIASQTGVAGLRSAQQ